MKVPPTASFKIKRGFMGIDLKNHRLFQPWLACATWSTGEGYGTCIYMIHESFKTKGEAAKQIWHWKNPIEIMIIDFLFYLTSLEILIKAERETMEKHQKQYFWMRVKKGD